MTETACARILAKKKPPIPQRNTSRNKRFAQTVTIVLITPAIPITTIFSKPFAN